ncbi:hypothetical protein M3Y97_00344900 [Aphelenchoides bicaudatus]|nr:hypothetical protein M3Y97_00344900 [Aphelenchoides bicaudatus]
MRFIKDLDRKILAKKEAKDMAVNAFEETQQAIAEIQNQRKTTHSQVSEVQSKIDLCREQLKAAKAERDSADQAKRQRSKKEKDSTMNMNQKIELNQKLESHYGQINELEERIDSLKLQKTEAEELYANFHIALKERTDEFEMLAEQDEEEQKRFAFTQSKAEEARGVVTGLLTDVQRLKHKLENPMQDDLDDGKNLFDQVISDKKAMENELVELIELTNVYRQQIRQKQDELGELETHEHENFLHTVDMDYVLSKMRRLISDNEALCMGLSEVESKFRPYICGIEQSLVDAENKPVAFSNQYSNLRDYSLECLKVVQRECVQGLQSMEKHFKEYEQLEHN